MRSREEINRFVKTGIPSGMGIVDRAMAFAEFAHDGQRDKGGHKYTDHVFAVGRETAKRYEDDNLTAAAYLHDVVEDGGFTISDLMAWFPPVVWKVVEILTRKKSEDRAVYIARIAENLLASKIKLVDLDNNMDMTRIGTPKQSDYERQDRYAMERTVILDAVIDMERHMTDSEMESDNYASLVMGV